MAFTFVTITHVFETAADVSATGQVEFTPIAPMHNGVTVVQKPITAALSGSGMLSQILAANTDPGTTPTGTVYKVVEQITGQPDLTYYVQVPHDAGSVLDLASLASWQGGTGSSGGVATINGESPDGSGNVVVSASDVGAQLADADLTGLAGLGDGVPVRTSGTWAVASGTRNGTNFLRDDGTWQAAGGSSYTSENARDDIAAALVAGPNITITPNDGADTITITAAATGSSGIPVNTVTAKGDLIAATGSGAVAPRSVGTNGQALLADSVATTGLSWGLPVPADSSVTNAKVATGAAISADKLADGTTNKAFLATERTKLAGLPTSAVDATLVNAKGDLIAATANDTVARLAVGSNGQVLKANSATTTGLEWGTDNSGATSAGIVNVKDYGAVGNGSTNDSTAIQTAIDHARDNGGLVYLPSGTYRADGLIFRDNVRIFGDGREASAIQAVTGSSNPGVFVLAEGSTQNVGLLNFGILDAGNAGQHGIYAYARQGTSGQGSSGLWRFEFTNIRISGFAGAQIWFRGGGTSSLDPIQFGELIGMTIERRNDSAASIGVLMSGQVNQTSWVGGWIDAFGSGSAVPGVNLKIVRELTAYDSSIDETTTYASTKSGHTHSFTGVSLQRAGVAVYVARGQSITFHTCHFEDLTNGVRVVDGSEGVRVDDCHFANSALGGAGSYSLYAGSSSLVSGANNWYGGTTGYMAATSGGSANVDVRNAQGTDPISTSNITRTITPAATIDVGKARTVILTTSGTAITTVNSYLFPGERVTFRASGGSVVFASGGNIGFGTIASPLTVASGNCVTLVKFDSGTAWGIESKSV